MTLDRPPQAQSLHGVLSVVAVALALVAPIGSASPVLDDVEAQALQAMGSSTTTAQLVAFLQEDISSNAPRANPSFTLHAESLHLETDHTDIAIGPPVEYKHDAQTTPSDHQDATITGLQHRDQYRFILTPTNQGATVTIQEGLCGAIEPSHTTHVMREDHVRVSRPNTRIDTSKALTWTGCNTATLTIQGDFHLRLWNWDAHLTTPDGETQTLQSGEQGLSSDPVPTIGSADEQYLWATNATLQVPLRTEAYTLYIQDANVQAQDGYRLNNAYGRLDLGARTFELQGDTLVLSGDDLQFTATGHTPTTISVVARGTPTTATLNGEPLTIQAAPDVALAWWATAAIIATILAGVAFTAYLVLRRRTRQPSPQDDAPLSPEPVQDSLSDQILSLIHDYGAITSTTLSTQLAQSRSTIQGVLQDLVAASDVKQVPRQDRTYYLINTHLLSKYPPDHPCHDQIIALAGPKSLTRWIYELMRRSGRMTHNELVARAKAEKGLSLATIHRHLDCLLDHGLLAKHRPSLMDQRRVLYEPRSLKAAARVTLGI